MPNPKRKTSKTRRDKRRTHYKATAKQMAVCPTTGEHHFRTAPSGWRGNFTTMVKW
jgi:ribosomal protein L32